MSIGKSMVTIFQRYFFRKKRETSTTRLQTDKWKVKEIPMNIQARFNIAKRASVHKREEGNFPKEMPHANLGTSSSCGPKVFSVEEEE